MHTVFFGVLAQVGPAGVLAWFGFYSLVFSPCRYLSLSLAHYSMLYHHRLVHFNLLWSGILSSSRFVHFSLIFPYWFSSISLVSTCLSATGFSKKVQNFLSLFISVFKRETSDLFHMRFSAREWKSGHSLSFFAIDFLISRPGLGWVCTLPIFFLNIRMSCSPRAGVHVYVLSKISCSGCSHQSSVPLRVRRLLLKQRNEIKIH